jgi:hypothetical protein
MVAVSDQRELALVVLVFMLTAMLLELQSLLMLSRALRLL